MAVALTPYAGSPDVTDPALTGEWAAGMHVLSNGVQAPPWCSYLATRDGAAVGIGAFKGAPDDAGDAAGIVEIAYITFVDARGGGVATEIAGALLGIARTHGIRRVRAHTLPEDNPSTRVLVANGFAKLGEVVDPEDGPVWRWQMSL